MSNININILICNIHLIQCLIFNNNNINVIMGRLADDEVNGYDNGQCLLILII